MVTRLFRHPLLFAAPASDLRLFGRLLCVDWDMPKLVGKVLETVLEGPLVSSDGCSLELRAAIQHALKTHKPHVLSTLLTLPGVSMSELSICQLYLQPDPTRFLSSNKELQSTLQRYSRWTKSRASAAAPIGTEYRKFYVPALAPVLRRAMGVLPKLLRENDATQAHDIFFWLIFQCKLDAASVVWPLCEKPVHVALLGISISKTLLEYATTNEDADMARRTSETLESWVTGMLAIAPSRRNAQQILSISMHPEERAPQRSRDRHAMRS